MVKFRRDNPGGEWLKRRQAEAEEHMHKMKGLHGGTTGWFPENLKLPVRHLKYLPGARDEQYHRNHFDSAKHQALSRAVEKHGFNTKDHPIMIGVNHRGEAHVMEGNHRLAHAVRHGHEHIHAEVKYYNGGEDVDGDFHPKKVADMHREATGMHEDVPVNNIGSGQVALFNPLIQFRKRRMSDMLRRWLNGR